MSPSESSEMDFWISITLPVVLMPLRSTCAASRVKNPPNHKNHNPKMRRKNVFTFILYCV